MTTVDLYEVDSVTCAVLKTVLLIGSYFYSRKLGSRETSSIERLNQFSGLTLFHLKNYLS